MCIAIFLLAGFCFGQAGSSPSSSGVRLAKHVLTNWSEFHFRHYGTRFNPYEKFLTVNNVKNLEVKWSYATGNAVGYSSPVVADGVVYVGTRSNLDALDSHTGELLWSYAVTGYVLTAPAVADGVVYFGTYNDSAGPLDPSNVYALNARTGALLWTFITGRSNDSSPAIANGILYIGSYDGNLYALNARTGAKLWSYDTGFPVISSPVVTDGVVYAGSNDAYLHAWNARTGAELWRYYGGGYDVGTPVVANGMAYAVVAESIFAVNARTGEFL